jgi:hypothetical protein
MVAEREDMEDMEVHTLAAVVALEDILVTAERHTPVAPAPSTEMGTTDLVAVAAVAALEVVQMPLEMEAVSEFMAKVPMELGGWGAQPMVKMDMEVLAVKMAEEVAV